MSGIAIIAVAIVAGLLGAGFGLTVAFFVLRSRQGAAPDEAVPPAVAATPAAAPKPSDQGDPAAQSPLGHLDPSNEDEQDDAIPTTVFRAEDLDLDALIAQADKLKK